MSRPLFLSSTLSISSVSFNLSVRVFDLMSVFVPALLSSSALLLVADGLLTLCLDGDWVCVFASAHACVLSMCALSVCVFSVFKRARKNTYTHFHKKICSVVRTNTNM